MSNKNYFVTERKANKQKLLEIITKNKKILPGKLKGVFSLTTGLSFKKIEEYLSELVEGGLIEYADDGTVTAL